MVFLCILYVLKYISPLFVYCQNDRISYGDMPLLQKYCVLLNKELFYCFKQISTSQRFLINRNGWVECCHQSLNLRNISY